MKLRNTKIHNIQGFWGSVISQGEKIFTPLAYTVKTPSGKKMWKTSTYGTLYRSKNRAVKRARKDFEWV